ncbi:hypothetical protein N7456_009531 [Penicillium angulare]|uniref:Uncharacterized protein n=1 Tax=Penicillium angulare TaxID=116970 RepID=A0A9W9F528_9EURO|nr:hypothetical protein N7456_009531 [Penicillium angulare]
MSFPSTTTDLAAFQGWWWGNSTSTATEILCPTPQTVYSSGTWLDCVSSGVSVVPTTCASGILEYSDDTDTTCVSPASCFTMTVAQTDPIVSPSKRYMCARDDWIYDTIYRNYYIPSSPTYTNSSYKINYILNHYVRDNHSHSYILIRL